VSEERLKSVGVVLILLGGLILSALIMMSTSGCVSKREKIKHEPIEQIHTGAIAAIKAGCVYNEELGKFLCEEGAVAQGLHWMVDAVDRHKALAIDLQFAREELDLARAEESLRCNVWYRNPWFWMGVSVVTVSAGVVVGAVFVR
jgi:hypothetical protein